MLLQMQIWKVWPASLLLFLMWQKDKNNVQRNFMVSLIIFNVFQDLRYIYGRYIKPSSEAERNMYVNRNLV